MSERIVGVLELIRPIRSGNLACEPTAGTVRVFQTRRQDAARHSPGQIRGRGRSYGSQAAAAGNAGGGELGQAFTSLNHRHRACV